MIERSYGKIEMCCDDCHFSLRTYDPDDFDVMISEAKEEGWRIIKDGKEWVHICPECKE